LANQTETLADTIALTDNVQTSKVKIQTITDSLGVVDSLNMIELPPPRQSRQLANFIFKIAGVEIPIKDFSINRTLSRGATGKVTTWDVYASNEDVGKEVELIFEDPGTGDQITIFKGKINAFEEKPPSKSVSLELNGYDVDLKNDVFMNDTTGIFEYTNKRADDVAKTILSGTDFTLIECPTDLISVRYNYAKRWDALRLIAEITNNELWVDDSKGIHIGRHSGQFTASEIISKTIRHDLDGLINRVIVIGGNTGDGKVPVGIAEDPKSISQYVRAQVETVPEIRDNETAYMLAKAYLERYNRLNLELELELPVKSTTIMVKEGMTITIDSQDYKITVVRIRPNAIRVTANPTHRNPSLLDYLQERLKDKTESATGASVFYNETPHTFTAYVVLDLDTAYYGGSTPKTIVANDSNTYTILSVMHFYVPDNFTAKEGELRIRWFGDDSPIAFKIVVNGDVYIPVNEGTAADGDTLYSVTINTTSLKSGWNDIYFVQEGG